METKNILIGVVVVLVVIGGGYWLLYGQKGSTSPTNTQTPTTEPNKNIVTVEYSGQGFSPNSIVVKSGTVVTWVNKGSDAMWVASNPHPVHTNLSGLDALKGTPIGGSYSYTFTKVGKWEYHNHLAPSKTGEVVVE
ncbi:MAG: hypothetical protein HYU80_00355 [Candidatus Blackburnbacteria bacterium]|nr:hypothetical protein [Candidatus Blackburnbacteria bacterium]